MFRFALTYLEENWLIDLKRKPLVLRGARQVGKTWLVRALAEKTGKQLIDINFERNPALKSLFETNDPKIILQNLAIYLNAKIDPEKSLLFLDEIQDAPEILAKLRWFYEELPALPVVAAGSLLEFVLEDHSFSMPVGRITYMHLEPLSFEEFLMAKGAEQLKDYIQQLPLPNGYDKIPDPFHDRLMDHFRYYTQVGGMPAAVLAWATNTHNAAINVMEIQESLLATYRDDFFKYKGRFDVHKLDTLIKSVPTQLGEKFVCAKADPSLQAASTKHILSLFNKARLCHKVQHTAGNRTPLAAETKDKGFKQIFLDVGLANRSLRSLSVHPLTMGIAEQVVGQMLRCQFPFYTEPALYYWNREEPGSSAEVDYLIEHKNFVVPIEVKSGSTGSLKSLHYFMHAKKLSVAVRINDDAPSVTSIQTKLTNGVEVSYTLLSVPFYMTGQIHRLLDCLVV